MQIERLRHSCLWSLAFCLASWEEVAWLRILQVTLISVDCKLVIEAKDFSLAQHDLCLFLLLKFSQFKNAAETFDLSIVPRLDWATLVNLRLEGAILFFSKLFLSSFLCNPSHLGLLHGFEILRELLAVV